MGLWLGIDRDKKNQALVMHVQESKQTNKQIERTRTRDGIEFLLESHIPILHVFVVV